jgi:hypothetical protein
VNPEGHVLYRLANAPLQLYPFPHFFARDVFPADYYAQIQRHLPPASALKSLEEARGAQGYPDRFVMPLGGDLPESLSDAQLEITDELLLVRDRSRYSLGPHTDKPAKVISVLFYLPADERLARHGTSIYLPKEEGFTADGGAHLPFEGFERLATMPFVPNSVFAFAKTSASFHGVEPIAEEGVERNLLLYDLRFRPAQGAPAAAPQVRFSM